MVNLQTNDLSLLAAIIGTSGAICDKTQRPYSFIFNWLYAWIRRIEEHDSDWKPDGEQRSRLERNLIVFMGFLVVGLSAFVTIIAAAMTLALDKPEWIAFVAAHTL